MAQTTSRRVRTAPQINMNSGMGDLISRVVTVQKTEHVLRQGV